MLEFNKKEASFSVRKWFQGLSSSAFLTPLPFTPYPFAFPEKALTFDWDNIGEDLNVVIAKTEQQMSDLQDE